MKDFTKRGFTLIEMLIVVVIIGILASALLPRLSSVRDKANDTARKADIQQLTTAMTSSTLDYGFPTIAGDTSTTGVIDALSKGGMKSIPKDPSNTSADIYGMTTSGYRFLTLTRNGQTNSAFAFVARVQSETNANYVDCAASDELTGATDIAGTFSLCNKVIVSTSCSITDKNNCQTPATGLRYVSIY